MILTCPACTARFMVADTAFGTQARQVRCGKCKHQWLAQPPTHIAPPPPPIELKPIPAGSNLPAIPSLDKTKLAKQVGKGAAILAVIGFGGWLLLTTVLGNFAFKSDAGAALALSDITTRYEDTGKGTYSLIVEGSIKNNSNASTVVPAVHITIKDTKGGVANEGDASVQRAELMGHDLTSFVYTLDTVPDSISDVTVEFASPQDTSTTNGPDQAQP